MVTSQSMIEDWNSNMETNSMAKLREHEGEKYQKLYSMIQKSNNCDTV